MWLDEAFVSCQGSEWTSLPVITPTYFSTKWNSCVLGLGNPVSGFCTYCLQLRLPIALLSVCLLYRYQCFFPMDVP